MGKIRVGKTVNGVSLSPGYKLGEEFIFTQSLPAENSRWWSGNIGVDVATLIDENPERLALLIVNRSVNIVYLSANRQDVVTSRGFPLGPGESLGIDSYLGAVYAASTAPTSMIGIIELYK